MPDGGRLPPPPECGLSVVPDVFEVSDRSEAAQSDRSGGGRTAPVSRR